MNIRPVAEEDIEAIINLFHLNYGEDYALVAPMFEQTVK